MTRLGGALLLFLISCPAVAHAATPMPLTYEVPAGCTSEDGFVSAVGARGASWPGPGEGRQLEVSVRPTTEGGGFVGSLRLRKPGSDAGVREVRGATCPEVVDALAAVTALALRESTNEAPATPAAAPPVETPARPVAAPPAEATGERKRQPGEMMIVRELPVTLSAGFASGYQPLGPATRFDLSLERLNWVTASRGAAYLLGPILRLRVGLAQASYRRPNAGSYDLDDYSAGLGPCMAFRYHSEGLGLMACSELALHTQSLRTRDEGSGDDSTRGDQRVRGSIGLSLHARYYLNSWLHVALTAGYDQNFGERGIKTPAGRVLFSQDVFSAYGQLGAGVHF